MGSIHLGSFNSIDTSQCFDESIEHVGGNRRRHSSSNSPFRRGCRRDKARQQKHAHGAESRAMVVNVESLDRKWSGGESNPRPQHCERCALPTELPPQSFGTSHIRRIHQACPQNHTQGTECVVGNRAFSLAWGNSTAKLVRNSWRCSCRFPPAS